jgi:hypothetical protein
VAVPGCVTQEGGELVSGPRRLFLGGPLPLPERLGDHRHVAVQVAALHCVVERAADHDVVLQHRLGGERP